VTPSRHRAGLAAALLVAAPVLVGLGYSLLAALDLAGPGASGAASTGRIVRVLGERPVWEGVAWSLRVSAAATLLAGGGAVLLAVLFRGSRPADRLARALALLPLPVPHVVAGLMGVLILGQSGVLARLAYALGWIRAPAEMPALAYDPAGIGVITALACKELPFLALAASSVLATRGEALEEAARSLGASPWQAFRRVTWPVLWRGLLPPAAAVFAFAVGSYEAAVLLAPSDPLALPLLTAERHADASLARRGDAFVLALLAFALAALLVAAHERLRARAEEMDG